jgi:glycosyltransferase involved in cell wall biosynthesis
MRIVHLTVARQLTHGQTKQLRFEYDAAEKLNLAEWTTLAYHNGPVTEAYVRRIPPLFRALFMRNLWGWLVALRLSRSHDILMMRHMTFDPFAFIFAPLIRNRVSVHHAKEVEELRLIRKGWKGRAASWLEKRSGGFAVRRTMAVMGVTLEIAEHEQERHAPGKRIGVYPNGVDVEKVALLTDRRFDNQLIFAFICGTFSRWHGLDKLIAAVDGHTMRQGDMPLTIHLIGRLSDQQKSYIAATEARQAVFKAHGPMTEADYRPLLECCDIGIASMAMERQDLQEGSTLKVREMLAMGLPVYSGHKDVALPESEDFVKITMHPTVPEMIEFATHAKRISRNHVRERSKRRIDKEEAMATVARLFSK